MSIPQTNSMCGAHLLTEDRKGRTMTKRTQKAENVNMGVSRNKEHEKRKEQKYIEGGRRRIGFR